MSLRPAIPSINVVLGVVVALALAMPVSAAVTEEEQYFDPWGNPVKEREERETLLDERAYKRLTEVQEDLSEKDYPGATKKLKELEKMRLRPYEEALVFQAYGYFYAQQDKLPQAIEAFKKTVELDALPDDPQQNTMLTLASLYAAEEQWQKVVDVMTKWFQYEKKPRAESMILMASANFQLENYKEALLFVQKAIASADKPTESWYQLELSIYLQQKQFRNAASHLRKMIQIWPTKFDYWQTLSGIYQELKDDKNALAALMLAYHNGLVVEESKILNVVRYNLFMQNPNTAGEILEKGISSGRVEPNQKNLELLLNAWTSAKEFDKAIKTIDRIAPMTGDGKFYLQKAQLLSEQGSWPGVIEAATLAVEKGLDKPGGAYLLIGIAHAEIGEYREAIRVLEQAMETDKVTRRQASDWIAFVKDRMQVRAAGP